MTQELQLVTVDWSQDDKCCVFIRQTVCYFVFVSFHTYLAANKILLKGKLQIFGYG